MIVHVTSTALLINDIQGIVRRTNLYIQKKKNRKEEKKMEILKKSKELTTEEMYYLTMSPETQKMSDNIGQVVDIEAWIIYQDVNKDGEMQKILSILTPEGETLATNSATFMGDFERLMDLFSQNNETVKRVEIISGTSKAGRQFVTVKYAK